MTRRRHFDVASNICINNCRYYFYNELLLLS